MLTSVVWRTSISREEELLPYLLVHPKYAVSTSSPKALIVNWADPSILFAPEVCPSPLWYFWLLLFPNREAYRKIWRKSGSGIEATSPPILTLTSVVWRTSLSWRKNCCQYLLAHPKYTVSTSSPNTLIVNWAGPSILLAPEVCPSPLWYFGCCFSQMDKHTAKYEEKVAATSRPPAL